VNVDAKKDLNYWKERLVLRRYPFPKAPNQPQKWSIRIEHSDHTSYFPLETSDTNAAALRALQIHESIVKDGWQAALARHPREITIGVEWMLDPVAWTYATLITEPDSGWQASIQRSGLGISIVIVDPDAGTRCSLRRCLAAKLMISFVVTFDSAEAAFQHTSPDRNELWLINQALPGMSGNECIERLRHLNHSVCGLTYSVYEDSDQLFLATPGGASGYFLKRTKPEMLLDPILTEPFSLPQSELELLGRVRKFFEYSLTSVRVGGIANVLPILTPREHKVMDLLGMGCVDKEIAMRLGISALTVRGHLKKIFEKLQVHTRTEAVVKYLQK
jgi:DNA-binding NarL/FixJ family response regulator